MVQMNESFPSDTLSAAAAASSSAIGSYNPGDAESLFRSIDWDITKKAKQLLDLANSCRKEEACLIVEKVLSRFHRDVLYTAFSQWTSVTKDTNNDKMEKDRNRWRMHAAANQDIDLQAWYHALFYKEVKFVEFSQL